MSRIGKNISSKDAKDEAGLWNNRKLSRQPASTCRIFCSVYSILAMFVASGKPHLQMCLLCGFQINILKSMPFLWLVSCEQSDLLNYVPWWTTSLSYSSVKYIISFQNYWITAHLNLSKFDFFWGAVEGSMCLIALCHSCIKCRSIPHTFMC